eukprot:3377391-Prymnesium_polylepis.1
MDTSPRLTLSLSRHPCRHRLRLARALYQYCSHPRPLPFPYFSASGPVLLRPHRRLHPPSS